MEMLELEGTLMIWRHEEGKQEKRERRREWKGEDEAALRRKKGGHVI